MLPEIRLDTDRFQNLIEEYRMLIAGIYPEWSDYNYHDPGITLLELFAWLKENQQFHMEQLGQSHYRQFLKLMGVHLRGIRPARMLAGPENEQAGRVQKGDKYFSGGIVFEAEEDGILPGDVLERLVSYDAQNGEWVHADKQQLIHTGSLCFYPFGRRPGEGNDFFLCLSSPLTAGQNYRLSVLLAEDPDGGKRNPISEDVSFYPLAEVQWSYYGDGGWKPLSIDRDETREFLFHGRISFCLSENMERVPQQEAADAAGWFCLRARLVRSDYETAPALSGISFNHISLVQRETKVTKDHPLLLAAGTGFPDQSFSLPFTGTEMESVRIEVQDFLDQNQFCEWTRQESLDGCGPSDMVFSVEEGSRLLFGDGWNGIPPEGEIRLLSLSVTQGEAGNIHTKSRFVPEKNGTALIGVRELSRGQDAETVEEAVLRMNREKRCREHAVSAEDYERLVMETPGLMLHSCKVLLDEKRLPELGIVVRPWGRGHQRLNEALRRNILAYLDQKRLIGTKLRLYSPEYIEVRVYLEAACYPQFPQAEEMVKEALREYFRRQEQSFGTAIQYGKLYGMLESMACVKHIGMMGLEAASSRIARNKSGDLIPPPGGIFLLKQLEFVPLND